jgi:hypothetical protein
MKHHETIVAELNTQYLTLAQSFATLNEKYQEKQKTTSIPISTPTTNTTPNSDLLISQLRAEIVTLKEIESKKTRERERERELEILIQKEREEEKLKEISRESSRERDRQRLGEMQKLLSEHKQKILELEKLLKIEQSKVKQPTATPINIQQLQADNARLQKTVTEYEVKTEAMKERVKKLEKEEKTNHSNVNNNIIIQSSATELYGNNFNQMSRDQLKNELKRSLQSNTELQNRITDQYKSFCTLQKRLQYFQSNCSCESMKGERDKLKRAISDAFSSD